MRHLFYISSLLFFSALIVNAQETDGFQTDLNAGFTMTKGNSDTSVVNLGVDAKNVKEKQETLLSAHYDYGRTTDTLDSGEEIKTTNLDRSKLVGQSNWLFSEFIYSFYNLTAEKDTKAKINYRINTGPGIGYYFLRDDIRLLNTETGLVYVFEEMNGNADDYAAFRLAQRFEYKFGEGARVWQSMETVLQFTESHEYFVNAELGAEAKLNARFSLRIVLKDKYDSHPESGIENNDITLTSGISVRL